MIGSLWASITTLSIALAPYWLYLLVKHVLPSSNFWEGVVVSGFGFWNLLFIQIVLLVAWFLVFLVIWICYFNPKQKEALYAAYRKSK